MEKVCPVCNGLAALTARCPRCGRPLTDGGAIENYYGPYSPYMDIESLQMGEPDTHCVHLLYCSGCGHDSRAALALIPV